MISRFVKLLSGDKNVRHFPCNILPIQDFTYFLCFQEDKSTLSKYKEAVEKRLHILEEQGYVYAYETISN